MALAMMSADEASSDAPCAIVRRSALYTSLGRRCRWTASLNVSDPNVSAAFDGECDVGAAFVPHAMMLLVAFCSADELMNDTSFLNVTVMKKNMTTSQQGPGGGLLYSLHALTKVKGSKTGSQMDHERRPARKSANRHPWMVVTPDSDINV